MSDTTTIEIRKEQKRDLDDLKRVNSESYKDVLQRLIENYGGVPDLTEDEIREIARQEITDRVVAEAQQ